MEKSTKRIIGLMILAFILVLIIVKIDEVSKFIGKLNISLTPFFMGIFLAYIINIPTGFFEKKLFKNTSNKILLKLKKPVSFLLSLILILLIVALIMSMVIPQAIISTQVLIDAIPDIYNGAFKFIQKITTDYPEIEEQIMNMIPQPSQIIPEVTKNLTNWAGNAANFIGGLAGGILNLIIAIFFSIYFVFRKETIIYHLDIIGNLFLNREKKEKVVYVADVSNNIFHNFIVGQVSEAFILGGLMFLCMTIFKFPYPAMVSSLMGLLALIPMIGAILGGFLGAIIIATVNIRLGLLYVVFFTIIQQLEGNLIYPKVVGSKVGLPALWVLFAVVVGSSLFGIFGTFFGVPIVAIIYTLLIRKAERNN